MSERVYFWKGGKNGALDLILTAPLAMFRHWYREQYDNSDASVIAVQAAQVRLLDNIVECRAIAFLPESPEQAVLLDALVCHFYVWCEWERTGLLVPASQSEWRLNLYQAAEPEVRRLLGDAAGKLWRYLCEGRPVGRPETVFPFVPLEVGFPKSFWTQEEVGFMYQQLSLCKNLLANRLTGAGFLVGTAVFEAVENAYQDDIGLIIDFA